MKPQKFERNVKTDARVNCIGILSRAPLFLACASVMAGACLTLAAAGPAGAAETGLSGLWLMDHASNHGPKAPALTAEAAAFAKIPVPPAVGAAGRNCLPFGIPGNQINEFALEIVQSPERIALISEQTELSRSIYLNTDKHPTGSEVDALWMGHSIGHFEGPTLVIDTANLNDRVSHIPGVRMTAKGTHIVERMHLEDNGQTLVNEMTFENPKLITQPIVQAYRYHRLPADAQLWEYVCDTQDPNWNSTVEDRPPGEN